MDEFRQNNRLRGALDAALSGLNGDPALAQRVLRCAEEKPRAAKKLSVGLVFALVALLAAAEHAAPRQKGRRAQGAEEEHGFRAAGQRRRRSLRPAPAAGRAQEEGTHLTAPG